VGGKDIKINSHLHSKDGQPLKAGIFISRRGHRLYPLFLEPNEDPDAYQMVEASGLLSYNATTTFYSISNQQRTEGLLKEHSFDYSAAQKKINFGGIIHLNESDRSVITKSSAVGTYDTDQKLSMNAVIDIAFKGNKKAFELMAGDLVDLEPIAQTERLEALYLNLGHFIAESDMATLKNTPSDDWNMSGFFPSSILLADVQLKWSDLQNAFYSEGKFGLGSVFKANINGMVDGFVYIPYTQGPKEFHLYVKSAEFWYYILRNGETVSAYSSNPAFNAAWGTKGNELDETKASNLIEEFRQLFMK
jgi:hypothetical protein